MSDDTIDQVNQAQPEKQPQTPQNTLEKETSRVGNESYSSEPPKEQNLRFLRERAENAEKRIAEMERYLQQQQPKQQQPQVDLNLDDESFVEAKYVKQIMRELQETKKQVQEVSQKSFQSTAELKLKSQNPDFDSIVTEENIRELANQHPEDYATLMANPDLYSKGKTAYNMIKEYGILEKYDKVDKKIEENKNKPRSAGTTSGQVADTPLSKIGEYDRRVLTKENKERLFAQVQEAKKYS